ncbi:hypothetical protein QG37_07865 [Candidozyma auris]|uniref:Uncharacterized protein n=1 Tax=Candidozyma auris TaxID=498019 RepID=A0A0L0NPC5_CANAR|nr:hypothetical protein QG37_07865 [[Candida] auris]
MEDESNEMEGKVMRSFFAGFCLIEKKKKKNEKNE